MIANLVRGGGRWVPVVGLFAVASGCATNPVTGRRQLALVSEAQEIELGRQSAEQVAAQLGLVADSALQAYVQAVGAPMAAASERPQLPWTFRVVDDPTPNAFALPGGFIFLTRGMMNLMDSEAELASVLGHEIGHVTARHSVTAISRAQLAQLGLGVGAIFFPGAAEQLGGLASGGLQLLFLRYGRDAERQADELAFRYALGRAYDVREMADVFQTLQRVGEAEGRSPLPSWLSTHPAPAERIEAARARVGALPPGEGTRVERATYLARIDGLVYGDDPRQGFFQDGLFLHPELRFRLSFPAGWRTQNLSQSVSALSPQQDAVVQLTLAQGSADQAAGAFLRSQGVRPGRTGREVINGNPAVVAYFQAQTQQGLVAGLAAFVEHGGRTYQVLTFTPAQLLGRYERVFGGVIGSFAAVTDPQVLSVRPNRLDVVRTTRAMTLAEFNRQHPSVIPLAELALLNQVEGGDSVLPAGLVKRVIRE